MAAALPELHPTNMPICVVTPPVLILNAVVKRSIKVETS